MFDLMSTLGHDCLDVDSLIVSDYNAELRESVQNLLKEKNPTAVLLQFGNLFEQNIYRYFGQIVLESSYNYPMKVIFLSSARVFRSGWVWKLFQHREQDTMTPDENDELAMDEFTFTIAVYDFPSVKVVRYDEIGVGLLFYYLQSFVERWNIMPNIMHFSGPNSTLSNSLARKFGYRFL